MTEVAAPIWDSHSDPLFRDTISLPHHTSTPTATVPTTVLPTLAATLAATTISGVTGIPTMATMTPGVSGTGRTKSNKQQETIDTAVFAIAVFFCIGPKYR